MENRQAFVTCEQKKQTLKVVDTGLSRCDSAVADKKKQNKKEAVGSKSHFSLDSTGVPSETRIISHSKNFENNNSTLEVLWGRVLFSYNHDTAQVLLRGRQWTCSVCNNTGPDLLFQKSSSVCGVGLLPSSRASEESFFRTARIWWLHSITADSKEWMILPSTVFLLWKVKHLNADVGQMIHWHEPLCLMVCLPFVRLQGSLLHSLGACRERQQSLALHLAWHYKHIGLEGVHVASDILRHNLWPFSVVPTVRQQWGHNLEEQRERLVFSKWNCLLWSELLTNTGEEELFWILLNKTLCRNWHFVRFGAAHCIWVSPLS